jgi:hypothetical protein
MLWECYAANMADDPRDRVPTSRLDPSPLSLPSRPDPAARPYVRSFGRLLEDIRYQHGIGLPLLHFLFGGVPSPDDTWTLKLADLADAPDYLLVSRSMLLWARYQRPDPSAFKFTLADWRAEAEAIDAELTRRYPQAHPPVPVTNELEGYDGRQMKKRAAALWAEWRALPELDTTPSPLRLKAQGYDREFAAWRALPDWVDGDDLT